MFRDQPETLPCGQHDKFAAERKAMGSLVHKNPQGGKVLGLNSGCGVVAAPCSWLCYFAFGDIMSTVVAPTCEQLSNEELPLADRKVDDSWRHGVRVTAVYRRDEDGTFWQANYRLSSDGETNELAEGLAKIVQVFPREINVTIYESK